MATPKPQIRSMFPTPVCVHFLPVAQEVNARIAPAHSREDDGQRGTVDAHGQGWRSPPDFESWGGASAQTLFRVLRELGRRRHRHARRRTRQSRMEDHGVRGGAPEGRVQRTRRAAGRVVVGRLLRRRRLRKSDDETLGGECELADPRGALPAMVAPHLAFRIPGGARPGMVETIRPQTGMILLHPSWQPRGERRYDGANQRVTIEFDLHFWPTTRGPRMTA
jgi:hypothetical protein